MAPFFARFIEDRSRCLEQTLLLAAYFEFSETCILIVCGSVAAVDDEIPNCARVKCLAEDRYNQTLLCSVIF
jgi:hypothetical protein